MAQNEYDAVFAAHQGDNEPLIEWLKSDAEITPLLRALIVKVLSGGIRRPKHRPKSMLTRREHQAIANRVRELGGKQMAAIAQVMSEFKCSQEKVKLALKADRQGRRSVEKFARWLNEINADLKKSKAALTTYTYDDATGGKIRRWVRGK
jgi:hypothetical protein